MAKTPAERRALLGPDPFERFTEHTIVDASALDDELAASQARGYVVACDDYILGFRVVAAPIRAADGAIVGCFFSSGRASGFPDERLHDIGLAITQATDLFSRTTPSLRGIADFLGSSRES
jgi:DNA-binding IclR family transcriptional regulator